MNNVVTFQPKRSSDAKQNLEAFIDLAKNELSIYRDDPEYCWDNAIWEGVYITISYVAFSPK